jgi:hypothetical protein
MMVYALQAIVFIAVSYSNNVLCPRGKTVRDITRQIPFFILECSMQSGKCNTPFEHRKICNQLTYH